MFSNLSVGAVHGTDARWVPAKKRDLSRTRGVRKVGFIENLVVKFKGIEI